MPESADRARNLELALRLSVLSIAVSAIVGISATVVGFATGALSLLGFGLDAAIDAAASIALVWRFRTERREPHRADSIERVAETIIGGVLLVLAAYLAVSAVSAIAANAHPEASPARLVLLAVGIVVLPPLAFAKHRAARALGSGALRADSLLTAIAAILALIGLVALALSELFHVRWGDAAGALVVAVVIAREGWDSLRAVEKTERIDA